MTAAEPLPLAIEADLPEGWSEARIQDCFQSWGGMTPSTSDSSYWRGQIPWVSSKNVKEWRIREGEDFITDKALRETRLRLCPVGSVLVVVRSGILAHTLPVAITDREVTINQDLKAFYSHEGTLNEWLALALRAKSPDILAINRKDGTTVQSIRYSELTALNIPVPPLAEQQRILNRVEQLRSIVHNSRERLARVPAILKRFRQAVLAAACSGRLTADWRERGTPTQSAIDPLKKINRSKLQRPAPDKDDPFDASQIPDCWRWARCEDICDGERTIGYGVIKLGPLVKAGVAILRSSDVRWLRIDAEQIKRISPKIAAAYSRTTLQGGEILVTVRGSLGGFAVVPSQMAGFNISREVAMVPIHSGLDATFFSYAIGCASSQAWLKQVTIGVAYTGINIRDLKRLPLPLPPLEEQREIVRRVEALFKLADAIEKRVAAATARAEKLTQAILAKAFRGELVPTEAELARREGRDYEPASILLARIQDSAEPRRIEQQAPTVLSARKGKSINGGHTKRSIGGKRESFDGGD